MNAPILSSLRIKLPTETGKLETFVLSEPPAYPQKASAAFNRVAFSAAHVVADARAANDPWLDCALDWDQTLRYREYLWDLNLGVAEAMDTAQRGMGLHWPTSLELITRAVKAGKAWEARNGRPALIASGCGTAVMTYCATTTSNAPSGNASRVPSITARPCTWVRRSARTRSCALRSIGSE